MNKATARELLAAYDEVKSALKRIRARQIKAPNKELDNFPDAFSDFRYFGDQLENALCDIEHLISDAKEIVRKSYGRN